MKKSKILGAILSLSMVINTLAVFMPVAQAADSKIISVTDILGEEKAANLKAEWIFQGTKGESFKDREILSTDGKHVLMGVNNVAIEDSKVMGSAMQVSDSNRLRYTAPVDVTDPETGEVTEVEKPLNFTGVSASYELWACISGSNGYEGHGRILSRYTGTDNNTATRYWALGTGNIKDGEGDITFYRRDMSNKGTTNTIKYSNSNENNSIDGNPDWQHIVIVKKVEENNSETFTLYLNGEAINTITLAETAVDNGDIVISYSDDNWHLNKRWVSSFRVFDTALSAEDVTALYKYQAVSVGLAEGDATLTDLTVNGEGIDLVSGTKAYTKTMDSTASVANLGITTKGVATYTCTVKKIVKETVTETVIQPGEDGEDVEVEVEKEIDVEVDEEVDPSSIPLTVGDNEITITTTAAGEPEQVYTLNLIRLPAGESPTRNANLGVLTGKTLVADWYFDVAPGATFYDRINGINLDEYGSGGRLTSEKIDNVTGFKKAIRSAAGAHVTLKSSGSVAAIDNARTWSGWVQSGFGGAITTAENLVWGKGQGKNYGYASNSAGWILQQVRDTVNGNDVETYYYQIKLGSKSGSNQNMRWRTVNTYENNAKEGDADKSTDNWKYITVSIGDNYQDGPSLYINGVKQELVCTESETLTGAIPSDAGIGVELGYANNSTTAWTRYANLRVFKEKFTEEDAQKLYQAEAVAAGFIEIPVEITMTEFLGDITATADYSVGNRSDDTVLFIARYNEDGQLEECYFTTKELGNEVSIPAGEDTDVVKAFVWDSLSTMKSISAVYDNTEL